MPKTISGIIAKEGAINERYGRLDQADQKRGKQQDKEQRQEEDLKEIDNFIKYNSNS